jgi:hypothetical protein
MMLANRYIQIENDDKDKVFPGKHAALVATIAGKRLLPK